MSGRLAALHRLDGGTRRIENSFMAEQREGSSGSSAPKALPVRVVGDDLRRVARLLADEASGPAPDADVIERLAAVLVAYLRGGDAAGARPSAAIARAVALVRERPAEAWTVARLARAVGLSRSAFARRFVRELGITPLALVTDVRLRLAEQLLVSGDDGLARIASAVGYESEFAFSRAFKRHFGIAPGTFRRAQRTAPRAMAA